MTTRFILPGFWNEHPKEQGLQNFDWLNNQNNKDMSNRKFDAFDVVLSMKTRGAYSSGILSILVKIVSFKFSKLIHKLRLFKTKN